MPTLRGYKEEDMHYLRGGIVSINYLNRERITKAAGGLRSEGLRDGILH